MSSAAVVISTFRDNEKNVLSSVNWDSPHTPAQPPNLV